MSECDYCDPGFRQDHAALCDDCSGRTEVLDIMDTITVQEKRIAELEAEVERLKADNVDRLAPELAALAEALAGRLPE